MFWRLGDSLSGYEQELSHSPSPLKDLLSGTSDMMKSLAEAELKMEKNISTQLGPDKPLHNLVNKDYRNMLKERDLFKKKQRDLEIASSKYQKEKEKRDNIANDYLYKDMLDSKQQR